MDPCAVHGYTVAPGNPEVREVLAKDINRRFGTNFAGKIYLLLAVLLVRLQLLLKL